MITPISALRIPPQSNTSSSPMPRPAVKMSQPTAAPTSPSTIDKSHDLGPFMPSNASLGTSARPMNPATRPRSSAPINSNLPYQNPPDRTDPTEAGDIEH